MLDLTPIRSFERPPRTWQSFGTEWLGEIRQAALFNLADESQVRNSLANVFNQSCE